MVALLMLAGCGDPVGQQLEAQPGSGKASGAAVDEFVASAVKEVLGDGDGSFRSRTTGEIPFSPGHQGVFEQSGRDVLEIQDFGSTASATAVVDDTAYEWDRTSRTWLETPTESFDPLIYPGFSYQLALIGLLEVPDREGSDPADSFDDMFRVAIGWTETASPAEELRRFELTMAPDPFIGPEVRFDDTPAHRIEEEAVTGTFYREAKITAILDIDPDGHLVRHVLRFVFDPDDGYADCAPLNRVAGTTEMVIEFSDVGADFSIEVPEPEALMERYPSLGEPLEVSGSGLDELFGDAFTNDAGERDLSGCPTTTEVADSTTGSTPTTSVESCQVEGVTIRTAVFAYQTQHGELPAALDDLSALLEVPSAEWIYETDGDEFELRGPCDLP
jgi:hypothetical protein